MKALVTLAFLFFFSSAFAQNAQEDQKYFPCNPGMKWVYSNDSTRVAVIEVKKITGSEIFIQTKTYLPDSAPVTEVFTIKNNMLLKTRCSDGSGTDKLKFLTPAEIVFKYPLEVGDCWSLQLERGSVERKIKKKHPTFTVKDKTYNDVFEVDERCDKMKRKFYYCKNIGLVQVSVIDSTNQYIPYMTLSSFSK